MSYRLHHDEETGKWYIVRRNPVLLVLLGLSIVSLLWALLSVDWGALSLWRIVLGAVCYAVVGVSLVRLIQFEWRMREVPPPPTMEDFFGEPEEENES